MFSLHGFNKNKSAIKIILKTININKNALNISIKEIIFSRDIFIYTNKLQKNISSKPKLKAFVNYTN